MADKVAPGQKVAGSALREAATVNDLLDMRHRFKSGGLDSRGHGKEIEKLGTDLVMVKNSSGADRERGEVLQLGDYLLTTDEETDNKWNLWFDGDTPATPLLRCVILQKPAKENAIVEAHGQGICVAKVELFDIEHTHAWPRDGEHSLHSDFGGPFELFSTSEDTGEQLMVVRFIEPGPREGVLDEDLTFGGVADVTLDGSQTIEGASTYLLETGFKLSLGFHVVVQIMLVDGEWKWRVVGCRKCAVEVES